MNGSNPNGRTRGIIAPNLPQTKCVLAPSASPLPRPSPQYVFSEMVGMARCAVPARVLAGGTNIRVALAFEEVAPLHAARTSQRDVPTTLNTFSPQGRGRILRDICAEPGAVRARLPQGTPESPATCSLSPRERVRMKGIRLLRRATIRTVPGIVEFCETPGCVFDVSGWI